MSRSSKEEAVKNLRQGTASIHWPIEAECNSCRKTWAATDRAGMDEFMMTVPGAGTFFLCPICRHMASYVVQPVSFADMRGADHDS
jgi:hypothetical protein